MERTEVIRILKEEGYPDFMLDKTADKIEAFSPDIATKFSEFCIQGTIPEIEVEGYNYKKLIEDFGMKPVGALITLDWLIREPENAKEALQKGIK